MDIYFRKLEFEDIPAIKDISKDIWEGWDYIPGIIEQWLKDENCLNYGAFIDENRSMMVGFGRIKIINNYLAWLEGGRVKLEYQRQGIGREMIKYALDYAYKVNAKVAQFDTSSTNLGSQSLAKHFGFKRKKSMNVLNAEKKDIQITDDSNPEFTKISAHRAKSFYKSFDISLGDEICFGWSYTPLNYITDNDGEWYIHDSDAIVQTIKYKRTVLQEFPGENEIWLIAYGTPKIAFGLLKAVLQKELQNEGSNYFEVFCHPDIANLIETIGFYYYEGKPFGVVLFEKDLNK
ncbi:MAG: GNAT family N-acetyltransferase [Promethearchaeota archaeon]